MVVNREKSIIIIIINGIYKILGTVSRANRHLEMGSRWHVMVVRHLLIDKDKAII